MAEARPPASSHSTVRQVTLLRGTASLTVCPSSQANQGFSKDVSHKVLTSRRHLARLPFRKTGSPRLPRDLKPDVCRWLPACSSCLQTSLGSSLHSRRPSSISHLLQALPRARGRCVWPGLSSSPLLTYKPHSPLHDSVSESMSCRDTVLPRPQRERDHTGLLLQTQALTQWVWVGPEHVLLCTNSQGMLMLLDLYLR